MMASDIMLNSNSDIDFLNKNCNEYFVIHCIDNTDGIGGIMMPITHCRSRPILIQSPLYRCPRQRVRQSCILQVINSGKSNFSVFSSNFSLVNLQVQANHASHTQQTEQNILYMIKKWNQRTRILRTIMIIYIHLRTTIQKTQVQKRICFS